MALITITEISKADPTHILCVKGSRNIFRYVTSCAAVAMCLKGVPSNAVLEQM